MGVTHLSLAHAPSLAESFKELGVTMGAAFGPHGMVALFDHPGRLLLAIMTIFAFSLTDIFDTIGTFIGTGEKIRNFLSSRWKKNFLTEKDSNQRWTGHCSQMLPAQLLLRFVGHQTLRPLLKVHLESARVARTGLTSLTAAVMFALSSLLAPVIAIIPTQATAPALIIVGIMMMSSFKDINWSNLEDAIPAFFASVFMAICYSISYGIAAGFIFYLLVKICKKKFNEIHPMLVICTILFILNFVVLAFI